MIWILEDDDSIRKLVIYALESQGIPAKGFAAPPEFWDAVSVLRPDLLLLDIMLPVQDGISVLKQLRQRPDTAELPVIMLTAKDTEFDSVTGLDAGADDYLAKPFGMMELVARIRAVLRRTQKTPAVREHQLGTLCVSPEKHTVSVGGEQISLTNKEFSLLTVLIENKGIVMSRETLLERVWGLFSEPENRTLDVHIRSLRAKLGDAGAYIETVRGIGYRIREDAP